MTKSFDDIQRVSQGHLETTMTSLGELSKGWQAIATEMGEYTTRSLTEGSQTVEKLMAVRSVDQAFEIQSGFASRACATYMQQMAKIGGLYSECAKDAYRPLERALKSSH